MKRAKSKGGASTRIRGLAQNDAAYQRCKYVDVINKFTNKEIQSSLYEYHRELRPIEIKKSKETMNKTVEAVKSFVNPFTIEEKENLYNIEFGVKV